MKTLKDERYAIIKGYHSWEIFLYCVSVLCPIHSLFNEKLCNICVPILTGFRQSCNTGFMFVVDFSPKFFDGQFHIIFQSFSAGIEKKFIWIFWKTFLSLYKEIFLEDEHFVLSQPKLTLHAIIDAFGLIATKISWLYYIPFASSMKEHFPQVQFQGSFEPEDQNNQPMWTKQFSHCYIYHRDRDEQ